MGILGDALVPPACFPSHVLFVDCSTLTVDCPTPDASHLRKLSTKVMENYEGWRFLKVLNGSKGDIRDMRVMKNYAGNEELSLHEGESGGDGG